VAIDDDTEPVDSLLAAVARIPERELQASISPGATIGRYRIVRELGIGGMGVVFEAADPELDRRVAIKVMRQQRGSQGSLSDRLRREAQALARLSHPNVVTVFDVGLHDNDLYIVMQLVDGTTLDRHLGAVRLPIREIVELFVRAGHGLAAAHAAGIIHRDFKPTNVLVGGDGSVRVSDFGLARETVRPTPRPRELDLALAHTLTASGLVGTPAYMAPEQFAGSQVSVATDQFAFCVALWEALYGERPFSGDTITALAEAVVAGRRREPPAEHAIPQRLHAALVRGLATKPEDRFGSMIELEHALTRRRERREWMVVVGALAAAVAAMLVWRAHTSDEAATGPRQAVAVLGFKNASGDPDTAWLSTGFAEMLGTDLGVGGSLRVIPGETVTRAKAELELPDSDGYTPDSLRRLRADIGADYVVVGSYVAIGRNGSRTVRFDVRVQDARRGDTIASLTQQGNESELFDLVTRSSAELRNKLGVAAPSIAEISAFRVALPSAPEAERQYAEGVAKLHAGESLAAKELLEAATTVDPRSAIAWSALAQAWSDLGYDQNAVVAAKRATSLTTGLSHETKLLIDGRYQLLSGDPARAGTSFARLFQLAPDDLEYGLLLAEAQTQLDDPSPALTTIAQLHQLPPPNTSDPRIELKEGAVRNRLGNPRDAEAAFGRAATSARARGARVLLETALLGRAWNLMWINDADRAAIPIAEALEILGTSGPRKDRAEATWLDAALRGWRGDVAGAARGAREAAAIYGELGNRKNQGVMLLNAAYGFLTAGDVPSARAALADAKAFADIVPNYADRVQWLSYDAGDSMSPREWYRSQWNSTSSRGGDRAELGDRYGNTLRTVDARADARRVYGEALELVRSLGIATTFTDLAFDASLLDLVDGRASTAESLAREAVERSTHGWTFYLGAARATLAWALALEGKHEEARKQADLALAAPATYDLYVQVRIAVGVLVVRDSAGGASEADVQRVRDVRARAEQWENPEQVLECRLALALHDLGSSAQPARRELATIAKDAHARGFELVAHRAEQATR
jgi:TolB-like protein